MQEVHEEGLIASLNDCVYRTMRRFNFSALIDIDEYILPREQDTLQELIYNVGYHDCYGFKVTFQWMQSNWESTKTVDCNILTAFDRKFLGFILDIKKK